MKSIRIGIGLLTITSLISCSQKSKTSTLDSSQDQVVRENKLVIDNNDMTFEFKSIDFQEFYDKFIADTIFQLARVKFPLEGQYVDFYREMEWNKEEWPYIKWDLRQQINKTDDSISIIQDDDRFFFGSYCIECGFSFEMVFENIEGEWYLTYRQENN